VCYDCDDDDDAVSRLRCCFRRATRLLRSTKVNGGGGDKSDGLMRSEVSRSNRTLSPRRSHSTSLTNTTLYTIVSAQTPQVKELLVDMKLHNKNYVYVDIKYGCGAMKFVTEVLPSHVFNMVNEPYGARLC
jgi:hypothetical protein